MLAYASRLTAFHMLILGLYMKPATYSRCKQASQWELPLTRKEFLCYLALRKNTLNENPYLA